MSGKAAAKATASVGKAAAAGLGKAAVGKVAFAGGTLAAFAGRRALWPAFFMGSVFSSAAWFGCFEISWSMMRGILPIPKEPDQSARTTGLLTLPITVGGTMLVGWRLTPAMAPPPESVVDISGLLKYARSVPLKHFALVGGSSAAIAAATCRVVQWRGGA